MSIYVDIHKRWKDFSLDVQLKAEDEILGLLGQSGSGKSMTLRCIAGIVTPDSGKIVLNGRTLFDSERGINLTPRERNVGLMFQNYALFPNMSVVQNIVAGVRDKAKRAEKAAYYLELLELCGLESRYPRELSGGQQQRVALARMMASEPEILMLDEPFSALDGQLRQSIGEDFAVALAAFRGTTIYVSHSVSEVYSFAAQTAFLSDGSVIEQGETKVVFARPQRVESARLLCCKNISPVERVDARTICATVWNLPLPCEADCDYVGVFGDDVMLCAEGVPARIEGRVERPRHTTLHLRLSGAATLLTANCAREFAPESEQVFVNLPPEKLLFLQR